MDFIPLLNIKKGRSNKPSISKLSLKSRRQFNQCQSQSLSQVTKESSKTEEHIISFSQPVPESRQFDIDTQVFKEKQLKSSNNEKPKLQVSSDTSTPSSTVSSQPSTSEALAQLDNSPTEVIDLTSTPEDTVELEVPTSLKTPPKPVKPSLEKLKLLKALPKPSVSQQNELESKTKNVTQRKGKKLVKNKSLSSKKDESLSSDDDIKSDIRLKYASKLQKYGKPEPKKFKFNPSPNKSPEKSPKCASTIDAKEVHPDNEQPSNTSDELKNKNERVLVEVPITVRNETLLEAEKNVQNKNEESLGDVSVSVSDKSLLEADKNVQNKNEAVLGDVSVSMSDKSLLEADKNVQNKNEEVLKEVPISVKNESPLKADNDLQNNPLVQAAVIEKDVVNNVEALQSIHEELPCPLCQKQAGKNRRAHMKSCAAKNGVSTAQLLKAIELQEKQATERRALGLPVIIPQGNQKVFVKKKNNTRPSKNADVQLAMALSRSLMEAQEQEEMRQARQLLEEEQAFAWDQVSPSKMEMAVKAVVSEPVAIAGPSNQLVLGLGVNGAFQLQKSTTVVRRGRNRNTGPSPLLLRTTQEERERRITEKVAMLLVGDDTENVSSEVSSSDTSTNISLSAKLKKLKCESPELWELAATSASDRESFYVQKLSSFVSPSKHQPGEGLKHLSQIPGRNRTPTKRFEPDALDMSLCSFVDSAALQYKSSTSSNRQSPPLKTSPKSIPSRNISYGLARDWGALLNCRTMSDVTVYVRGEIELWAHSLVLFARCPVMLKDIAKEMSPGGKRVCEQMLLWDEVSKETALAMLEFIYCDTTERAIALTLDQQDELKELAKRYQVKDLLRHLLMLSKVRTSLGLASPKKSPVSVNPKSTPEQRNDPKSTRCSEGTPQKSPHQRSPCSSHKSVPLSQRSRSPDPFASSEEDERPDIDFLVSMMEKSQGGRANKPSQGNNKTSVKSPNKTPSPKLIEKRKLSANLSPHERTPKKTCIDVTKRNLLPDLENTDQIMLSPVSQKSSPSPSKKLYSLSSSQLLDLLENDPETHDSDPEVIRGDSIESPIISDVWNDFDDFGCIPMTEMYINDKTPVVLRHKSPDTIISVSSTSASPSSKSSQLSNSSLSRTLVASPSKTSHPLDYSIDVFENADLSALERAALNAYNKVVSPQTPKVTLKTPVNKKSVAQNNVTPMADYSLMESPALKAELDKYGIRHLRRNQAKLILRHIYNELHPFVPATPVAGSSSYCSPISRRGVTRAPRGQGRRGANCAVRRADARPYNNVHDISLSQPDPVQDDEEALYTGNGVHNISLSQPVASHDIDNSSSSESDSSLSSELSDDDRDDFFDADIGGDQILETAEQIAETMSHLIVSEPELHHRMLVYEPIWLAELKDLLKKNGKRCKPSLLLDYLDEHCITFRAPRPQRAARVRGGTQRRKRSPTKAGTASQRGNRGRRRRAATQAY